MHVPALLLAMLLPTLASAQSGEAVAKAVTEIERLDALRASLATTFQQSGAPADKQAFTTVCAPVGRAMKEVAAANGWQTRQIATKYRNPANAADAEGARVLGQFARDTALHAVVLRTAVNGVAGTRYLRRITVQPACLMCHGTKASRPSFVITEYPGDLAHGFRVGDLRGAYSVFIPNTR